MKKRSLKRAIFISIVTLSIFGAATFLPWAWAAISNISGIAVQGSSIQWNNVKDAFQGDDLTTGIPATGLYQFDGTNWDRARGDTTYGLDVDVTRVGGTVTIAGATTPADAFANPTTALTEWALGGVFNGTTWDRRRSATADALASTGMAATGLMGYNGATWDRLRSDTTNGLQVNVKALAGAITPADTYANPTTAIQSWSLLAGYNGTTWDRLKATGGNLQVQTTTSSTFTTGQVSIDNTAPLIKAANTSRKSVVLRNTGATDAYIGIDNTVSTSTGFLIKATESITLDRTTAAIYGVTAGAGTTTFAYLEE